MWNQGYYSADSYPAYIHPSLNPHYLAFLAVLNGFAPVKTGDSFRYCELGCGPGVTLLSLAAANPNASFVGIDLMPQHVSQAKELADRSGLTNIQIHQRSFGSIGPDASELGGKFHFIVLHGVYSWVDHESRAAIDAFLETHLEDGGLAYVCYNSLPGSMWRVALARLMYALRPANPSPDVDAFGGAKASLTALLNAMPVHKGEDSPLRRQIKKMEAADQRYAPHEYFLENPVAYYAEEIAQRMGDVGLEYIADAQRGTVALTVATQRVLAQVAGPFADAASARTISDCLLERALRCDLFARGKPTLNDTEIARIVADAKIYRVRGRDKPSYPDVGASDSFAPVRELADQIFACTATGATSLREVFTSTPDGENAVDGLRAIDALLFLLDAKAVEVRLAPATCDHRTARAWNALVIEEAEKGHVDLPLTSAVTGCYVNAGIGWKIAITAIDDDHVGIDADRLTEAIEPRISIELSDVRGDPVESTPQARRAALLEGMQLFVNIGAPMFRTLGLIRGDAGSGPQPPSTVRSDNDMVALQA